MRHLFRPQRALLTAFFIQANPYLINDRDIEVEYLIGYEGDKSRSSGDISEDLLSITSVHPLRERQVQRLLEKADRDLDVVHRLVDEGKLIQDEARIPPSSRNCNNSSVLLESYSSYF